MHVNLPSVPSGMRQTKKKTLSIAIAAIGGEQAHGKHEVLVVNLGFNLLSNEIAENVGHIEENIGNMGLCQACE